MDSLFGKDILLLILLAFLFSHICLAAVNLVLSGSSVHAVRHRVFVFTCTVNGSANLKDKIGLYMGDYRLSLFMQRQGNCVVSKHISSNFNAACGDGTNSRDADVRSYSLTINNYSEYGDVDYVCKTKLSNDKSNTLTVKTSLAVIEIHGLSSHASLDEMYVFTCIVRNAVDLQEVISIYRESPVPTRIVSLEQNMTDCKDKDTTEGYTMYCLSETKQSTSATKSYIVIINQLAVEDFSNWTCHLELTDVTSESLLLNRRYTVAGSSKMSLSWILLLNLMLSSTTFLEYSQ